MTARRSGLSALLPAAGMEICRLYVLASLFFLIPGSPPYPFAALACMLTAGTLTGRGLSFVAQRRISTLLVYGALSGLFVFLLARQYSGYAFWLMAIAAASFFFRGVTLGEKGVSHSLTVTRYDIGMGIFFFVYFLRFIMHETDPFALRVLGAYFLFSILALAASRSWEKDGIFTGYRPAMSFLVLFIAVFILAASAIVLLYPLLAQAAGSVYVFLRDNSGPVLEFLAALLRFLFRGRNARLVPSPPTDGPGRVITPKEFPDPGILGKILMGISIAVGAVLLIALIAMFIYTLVIYLSARKGPDDGKGFFASLRGLLRYLFKSLAAALCASCRAVLRLLRSRRLAGAAEEAFRRLCGWGRVSGLPRRLSETPAEYASRLGKQFPAVAAAAHVLANALEEELYAGRPTAEEALAGLKAAQMDLTSPSLIPARLSSFFRYRSLNDKTNK